MSAENRVATTTSRPPAATAVAWLAVLSALGSAAMSVAHLGVELPVLGGGVELVPVAVGFAVGAVLYALVAVGAFALRGWSWPLALIVNALAVAVTAAPPFRGGVEAVALGVGLVALALLVSRPGRQALLYRNARGG